MAEFCHSLPSDAMGTIMTLVIHTRTHARTHARTHVRTHARTHTHCARSHARTNTHARVCDAHNIHSYKGMGKGKLSRFSGFVHDPPTAQGHLRSQGAGHAVQGLNKVTEAYMVVGLPFDFAP